MSEKITSTLEKIALLLAKAESSTFPAEAEAFSEHAERLMIRHGIEQAQVDAQRAANGQVTETIIKGERYYTGTYKLGRIIIGNFVAKAFNTVTTLQQSRDNWAKLYVIGAESDVEQILRLIDSLQIQADVAMAAWWKTHQRKHWLTASEKSNERRQFLIGFGSGAGQRIQSIYGEESVGNELVLVGRKDRAEEAAPGFFPGATITERARKLKGGSQAAANSGVAAGKQANVSQSVSGRASHALAI